MEPLSPRSILGSRYLHTVITVRTTNTNMIFYTIATSVPKPDPDPPDPDPPDPHVSGNPGSGSTSQRYGSGSGSGSGSFYHQAKIVRKTLIATVLRLHLDFLSLKNDVNEPSKSNKLKILELEAWIRGSGSGSKPKRHVSGTLIASQFLLSCTGIRPGSLCLSPLPVFLAALCAHWFENIQSNKIWPWR